VLNREQFETLSEAQAILEAWREQYNGERPHSALGSMPAQAPLRCARPGTTATSS
jgi:putative transposase